MVNKVLTLLGFLHICLQARPDTAGTPSMYRPCTVKNRGNARTVRLRVF